MTDSLKRQVTDALRFAEGQARRLVGTHAAPWPLYTERGAWRTGAGGEGTTASLCALTLVTALAGCPAVDAEFWQERADALIGSSGDSVRIGHEIGRRFQPNGQYLASEFGAESLRIDSMLEVVALFDAAQAPGDGPVNAHELRRRAVQHCLTVQRVLCRGDGSVAEEGVFEAGTGAFLRQTARRGFRGDSCWSAGLAWAIYGFVTCYQKAGDRRLLKTAEDLAEFWMSVTPDHGVPPWDFDAPLDGRLTLTQPDSGAAAGVACGLFELAKLTHDRVRARAYEEFALRTVETLTRPPYLASDEPAWEGILKHGVYDMPRGLGVDESVMAGDAFFVQAMTRALALL